MAMLSAGQLQLDLLRTRSNGCKNRRLALLFIAKYALLPFFHNYLLTLFPPQNGFRRIGLTPFLAYSPDPSHASRKITIASDPETPSVEFESTNPTSPNLSPAEIRAKYPLHRAIGINKTSSIAAIILAAHQADAGNVRIRDVYGCWDWGGRRVGALYG